jgi:hypothetical protein
MSVSDHPMDRSEEKTRRRLPHLKKQDEKVGRWKMMENDGK